ncbi:MAG: M81 family metallopeptidase [Anaerolineae bacterium]|nr:M81 family metallopeptidase [Anaerolineae bacterium]
MKKRVLIGGFMHETNTFNPFPTGIEEFKKYGFFYGQEIIQKRRQTNTELGGFIEELEQAEGIEIFPSIFAGTMAGGIVTSATFDLVTSALLNTLRETQVDGILLALHGAMVAEGHDDGEGDLLESIRELVGPNIPIVITLDLHATLTPKMAAHADAMVIYRTYPHMDKAERGREAAQIMLRTLAGEISPTVAVAKRPLLIGPPQNVLPSDEPMRSIMARAREMEKLSQVIAACPAHGFMQQDVPFAGVGTAVTTDGNPELAQSLAEELADLLFQHRRDYLVELPSPEETIALAARSSRPTVAIADVGDNIGAGTPGDGTALLHEILRQGVKSAFVTLWDPEAAQLAAEAGVGKEITLAVGGKSDPLYGPPAEITGRVRTITDGIYLNREGMGYSAGVIGNMGLSVRIDSGELTIVLNSIRTSPNNLMHAYAIGVYPQDYQMVICKGGLAFREAYKPPIVNSYIQSDTPGYSSCNLERFSFKKLPRPIFPLDDI